MTTRFDVRAVVLATVPIRRLSAQYRRWISINDIDAPLPAALNSDHFFSGFTSSGRGGVIPSVNGPAESSRRAPCCVLSSAFERSEAEVGLLLLLPAPALGLVFTFAWVANVWAPAPGRTRIRIRAEKAVGAAGLHRRRVW